MKTRINDIDEFEYFTANFRRVHTASPEQMAQLLAGSLQPKHRDYLKTILATKRVVVAGVAAPVEEGTGKRTEHPKDEEKAIKKANYQANEPVLVPRKIIKVKRRNAPEPSEGEMAEPDFSTGKE